MRRRLDRRGARKPSVRDFGQYPDQDEQDGLPHGEHDSGPKEAVKGAVEGIKGTAKELGAKELGGTIAGRDDIVKEGKAQRDKADAERDAAKKEAEADSPRAGAKAAEERQREHQ